MANSIVKNDSQENRLSDTMFDDWEEISSDFGRKIKFGDGTKDTTAVLVGEFTGLNVIPVGDGVDSSGNPLDTATACEFVTVPEGEKVYAWLNFALQAIINDDKMIVGDTVRISFAGTQETKRNLNPVTKLTIARKPR